MKSQQALSLILGALAICIVTLAVTRSTEAQGLKIGSAAMKTSARSEDLPRPSGVPDEVSHFVVDENYAWATVGTTVYRIDRNNLSLSAVQLRVNPAPPGSTPPGLIDAPKSGIRSLLKPPGSQD